MSKTPAPITRKPTVHNFHLDIEPGMVSERKILDRLEHFKLDPVFWAPSDEIYARARELSTLVYEKYEDLDGAYDQALYEVQKKMGDAIFNRLEGAGAAATRRLMMAAYFIGVHCGRMSAGGAR